MKQLQRTRMKLDRANEDEKTAVPEELAILPLRGVVVYPLTFQALNVG